MLIKHILSYFVSRGLTGIINFAAIALYTRMLTTSGYGEYALILATAGLINAFLFQWIRLVLLRFLPQYKKQKNDYLLLGTLFVSYIVISFILILFVALSFLLDLMSLSFTVSLLFLVISQSIFECVLELLRSSLYSKLYGFISILKALSSLLLAFGLIKIGLGPLGIVIGLILGVFLSLIILFFIFKEGGNSLQVNIVFDYKLLIEYLKYGIPLTITLSLSFIMNQSDRFLLGWLIGKGEVGVYSAAYDLTQQTIIVLMMVVNLACYPLYVRTLENRGVKEAQKQIGSSITVLFLVAIPITIAIITLPNSIASILLGEKFSLRAADIMPILAISALLQGVKIYYFDLSFQLGKKTSLQIWPVLVGGVINIILNILLIPLYGITGTAYATLLSYVISIILSWAIGKFIFPIPFPLKDVIKIAICSFVMGMLLFFRNNSSETLFGLILKVAFGLGCYFVMIYIFNVWNIRVQIRNYLKRRKNVNEI
jgi:O-antigen/teichoic acid export membrane protein